ncbi:MAG TPA: diguanylate cyclase [Spirochaetota bacterium]|nr:diguanylate cyclase [Spirochaetota bacterium]HPI87741.1 diguanylate cyclase [Spirochaetota bacterium]HPR48134.1 diguanylate cyclase [Spirochaetota bacterium]
MHDIARFNRLLDNMQDVQKSSEDRKAFVEIGTLIRDLNSFLLKNDVNLNAEEENEISAIAGSKLSPALSKTKIEDVIYRIKQRAEREISLRKEREALENEIKELNNAKLRIIDWFRVTKWALDYGTISLFSHKLKRSSLNYLQKRAYELICSLVKGIRPVLDQEYYLLSVLEYNSIELLLQVHNSLEQIRAIPQRELYSSPDILAEMDDFTNAYVTLVNNAAMTERALKKGFKKVKAPHGFWGDFYEFLGSPLHHSRPVKLPEYDRITKTVGGVLFSYYTSQSGVIVRTINQAAFISKVSGVLESSRKRLTRGAIQNADSGSKQKASSDENVTNRFEELDRIISLYIPKGAEIAERLIKYDLKMPLQQWAQECETKPMLRIKKIVDDFIHFFVEPLAANSVVPFYDNREYPDYFEKIGQLKSVLKNFSLMDFDLVGTKEKDFTALPLPQNSTAKQLIFTLTRLEIPKASYDSRMVLAQSILQKIANASYQLALILNDFIKKYYNNKKFIQQDVTANYDFFIGAAIRLRGAGKVFAIIRKENLTLAEFLERGCSIAFHISDLLNHEGIEASLKEREILEKKLKEGEVPVSETGDTYEFPDNKDVLGNKFLEELDQIYRDNLTGFWNFQYFQEQVAPKVYDDQARYQMKDTRIVFLLEIDGLKKINELWGHSVGDRILVKISQIILKHANSDQRDPGDLLIKYEGGAILGYLNNRTLSSAVDMLVNIRKEVNGLDMEDDNNNDIGIISIRAGVYQEWSGTDYLNNIKITDIILNCANAKENNMIGFMRDQNRIVSEKDIGIGGDLPEDILTAV